MLKPWLELARISNLPTAWTNVLAGWLLARGQLNDHRLLWLLLGGSLLYCGGMILNDAADAGWDREHRKERPIPRGDVSVGAAWGAGLMMLTFGCVAMQVFGGASAPLVGLLALCILIYDLHHKQWVGSIFVMGACRMLLYLVAASPVLKHLAFWFGGSTTHMIFCESLFSPTTFTSEPTLLDAPSGNPMLAAIALGSYVVGVTLLARWEGKRIANGSRLALAVVLLSAPAFLCLAGAPLSIDSFVFGRLPLLAVFVALLANAIRIMRQGGPSIGRAVGILLAGIAVVDGLAVASVSFPLACGFVALAPLLRLWQRWIAAT